MIFPIGCAVTSERWPGGAGCDLRAGGGCSGPAGAGGKGGLGGGCGAGGAAVASATGSAHGAGKEAGGGVAVTQTSVGLAAPI